MRPRPRFWKHPIIVIPYPFSTAPHSPPIRNKCILPLDPQETRLDPRDSPQSDAPIPSLDVRSRPWPRAIERRRNRCHERRRNRRHECVVTAATSLDEIAVGTTTTSVDESAVGTNATSVRGRRWQPWYANARLPLPFSPSPDFLDPSITTVSVRCVKYHYNLVNNAATRSCAYGFDLVVFLPKDCRFMPIHLPLIFHHMSVVVVVK